MYLENVVFDAADPQRVGRFWQALLDAEQLSDGAAGFETRVPMGEGHALDLCFQPVPEARDELTRVLLAVASSALQRAEQSGLLPDRSGAAHGEPDTSTLRDPEGTPFEAIVDAATGPIPLTAVRLEVGDPARDAAFWSWLTGWQATASSPLSLRHPSGTGALLQLVQEQRPKGPTKSRLHLDVRLERGEDPGRIETEIRERGGQRLAAQWGDLPWRSYQDASGNEFCVLPARA